MTLVYKVNWKKKKKKLIIIFKIQKRYIDLFIYVLIIQITPIIYVKSEKCPCQIISTDSIM